MSEKRTIIIQAGAVYNEHVDKQVFFQGTVVNNMQYSNGNAPNGTPPQEQYMKPVEAICAETEESLEDVPSYPESPLDAVLFNEALDMPKLKQALGALVARKRQRGELKIAHWFIVWKVFRRYNFIPKQSTQSKFIQWVTGVFGWDWQSKEFKGSVVPDGVRNIPLETWTIEKLSAQRPQAEEYMSWRDTLVRAFLTDGGKGRKDCKEELCHRWFDTNLG